MLILLDLNLMGKKMDEHSSLIFLFFILFYENNEF